MENTREEYAPNPLCVCAPVWGCVLPPKSLKVICRITEIYLDQGRIVQKGRIKIILLFNLKIGQQDTLLGAIQKMEPLNDFRCSL